MLGAAADDPQSQVADPVVTSLALAGLFDGAIYLFGYEVEAILEAVDVCVDLCPHVGQYGWM
jgi:hypothetical protein